jgi:hypothetical protein
MAAPGLQQKKQELLADINASGASITSRLTARMSERNNNAT